jgi:hypothetical protein
VGTINEFGTAASQAAMKLIESIRSAIGVLYQPRYIRKLTDARKYEIKEISQALRENSDISIQYEDNGMVITNPCYEDLAKRAGKRLAFQEIRKQENMENVIDHALCELQMSTEEVEEDVDLDWISRFLSYASNISDRDLQLIWSKILAGEILRPNSYSLRVLDVLEKISKEEALLFKKLSEYFLPERGLFTDNTVLNDYSIKYGDILKLDECGLMNSASGIANTIELQYGSKTTTIQTKQFVLLGETDTPHKKIHVQHYRLTEAGMKLHDIISLEDSDMNYNFLVSVSKSLINTYKDCTFSLHRIVSIEKGIVSFQNNPIPIST